MVPVTLQEQKEGHPSDTQDLTRALSRFAANAAIEHLSVTDRAHLHYQVIDAIGCSLGAQALEQGRMYIDYVRNQGGTPQATVLGTSTKTSAANASWANAGLINTLDFDDTLYGHPGATVVGPALAIAESLGSSWADLLIAVAVGYEVSLRVAEAIRPSVPRWRQVAASSTAQTFGAAAVAAKLLKLDVRQTAVAYGLAASMAPVPAIRKFGTQGSGHVTWTKNQYAAAAMAGVIGAQLSAQGAVGPEDILDGPTGFWIIAGSDQFTPERITNELGAGWRFHNVAFKPYPCCRFFHPAIDGLSMLVDEPTSAADVASIRVSSVSHLLTFLNRRPRTPYDAEFSLPHALALTALRIPPGLAWFDQPVREC